MTVLSDRWIKKMSKSEGMIKPFLDKQNRKESVLLDYLPMDMTQEFQMNLKFLLM